MNDLTSAQIEIAKAMLEKELQDNIMDAAHKLGWRIHIERTSVNQQGVWSTAIQGDPGYQDMTLSRNGITLLFELKTETGKLTDEQKEWFMQSHNAYVIRPRNWLSGEVEELLK